MRHLLVNGEHDQDQDQEHDDEQGSREEGLPRSALASSSVDGVDYVAAGLFDFFQLEKVPLLRFEEQLVERAEPMSALVKAGVLPLDRFFHQ